MVRISPIRSFASVVMMVQERTSSPSPLQLSQSPAKAKGELASLLAW